MTTPLEEARAVLLRALEQLDNATEELEGDPERLDLVVIYSAGRTDGEAWHEIGGWSATAGPKWTHAALLRRAASAHDEAARSIDEETGDE